MELIKSPEIKDLAAALLTFSVKVDKIKKEATNPFFKSKYATLSNILDAIQAPLQESNLVVSQFPKGRNELTTLIIHATTGQYLECSYEMTPVKDDPQAIGSCITYQRRYALAAALNLNIDDDDDGNKASHTEPPVNKKEIPWLNPGTREWEGAVAKLKASQTTVDAIKKHFRLSKPNEEKLLKDLQ